MAFYTLLTTIGAAKLANAQVTGVPLELTEIAVGDGLAGAAYEPSEAQTELKNEVWRAAINATYVHADNANWMVFEGVVPEASGGWYVREVGIFDVDGDLFAIGKYPDTYKPALAEGSAKDLYIRMILEISNTAAVTLKIDPAIVLATRKYVDDGIAAHDADPAAHDGVFEPMDENTVRLNEDQAWDKNHAQTLTGTKDADSLDAMAADTFTCVVGMVAEIDADIDGTIAAPAAGYGFGATHIYNNGTRSLIMSGWPAGGAQNGGTLAGTAGTIDTIEYERMSVNGADKLRYNIFNDVGA